MPSTTYSKGAGGKLELVFSARFSSSTTHDAGFPGQAGDSNIVLQCTVSDSSGVLGTTYIRSAVPTSHLVLPYPGGNVPWTIEISHVTHQIVGLGSVSAEAPSVDTFLIKA